MKLPPELQKLRDARFNEPELNAQLSESGLYFAFVEAFNTCYEAMNVDIFNIIDKETDKQVRAKVADLLALHVPLEDVQILLNALKSYLNLAPCDGWHFSDCSFLEGVDDDDDFCSCGAGVKEAELREALEAFNRKVTK